MKIQDYEQEIHVVIDHHLKLDIAPIYSSFMSDMFKKPIILDASGYMDILTMDKVMKKRVIYSVGLGGQFWVETLAYSLVSGNCKMKLIKIF